MKNEFQKEIGGIYRLKVPFENLYTSVFLIENGGEYILVDCATKKKDVDEWIEPALKKFGIDFSKIDELIVSHDHSDHSGGLEGILQKNSKIRVVRALETIDGLEIYPLRGHTDDCIGVLDLRTGTLISCDGLQGAGVGIYRCYVENKKGYLATIEKIEHDKRINNILFSHAYEPWEKEGAFGREEVEKVLQDCKKYV